MEITIRGTAEELAAFCRDINMSAKDLLTVLNPLDRARILGTMAAMASCEAEKQLENTSNGEGV